MAGRDVSQFIAAWLRPSAVRLGEMGVVEGDGERVRAGVGGKDDGRVYDVHVRAQIAHVGAAHLACVGSTLAGWRSPTRAQKGNGENDIP